MNTIRLALSFVFLVVLVGGYAMSQAAAFGMSFSTADYAARVDQKPVWLLALVLLLAAIALGFVPNKEEPPD